MLWYWIRQNHNVCTYQQPRNDAGEKNETQILIIITYVTTQSKSKERNTPNHNSASRNNNGYVKHKHPELEARWNRDKDNEGVPRKLKRWEMLCQHNQTNKIPKENTKARQNTKRPNPKAGMGSEGNCKQCDQVRLPLGIWVIAAAIPLSLLSYPQ